MVVRTLVVRMMMLMTKTRIKTRTGTDVEDRGVDEDEVEDEEVWEPIPEDQFSEEQYSLGNRRASSTADNP